MAGPLAGVFPVGLRVILLLRDFAPPRLGKAALDQASAATGVQLRAKAFRLNLLRGLVLEGVEATSTAPIRSELHVDRLVFQHRWLPLLTGTVAVDKVLADGLRLKVRLPSAARGAAAAPVRARPTPAPGAGAFAVQVSEIAFRRVSMEILTEGQKQPTATLKALSLRLRNVALEPGAEGVIAGLSGEGDLRIDEIAFATTHVRGVQGEMHLRKGQLDVRGVRFTTEEGRFEAGFTAELARTPLRYTLTLKGDLDINASAGAAERGGFGPGSLDLRGEGEGGVAIRLKPTGTPHKAGVTPDRDARGGEARKGVKKALEKTAAGRFKDLLKR